MFEFNFYPDTKKEERKSDSTVVYSDSVQSFTLDDGNENVLNLRINVQEVSNDLRLYYIDQNALEDYLRGLQNDQQEELSVFGAVQTHEDVKPGLIEGGFTLWDGSRDLVHYIFKHFMQKLNGKNVLELGCGCGLPGILAVKAGARFVRFQDYNSEVLKWWTIPNVNINLKSHNEAGNHGERSTLEFFSGDWCHLSRSWQLNNDVKFEYIFTSETIYRSDLYERLHEILETTLSRNGIVLLACKASYGPGGSMFDWLNFIEDQGVFQATVCEITNSGAIRYVVQMTRL
ncbi:unnamed protein product [Trichobilharzia szidati]|nr:unnamed protein product [Trichobilharzia szidati]